MLASAEAKGLAEHDHGLQNRYGFFGSTKTVGFNLNFLFFLKKYKPENLVINQKTGRFIVFIQNFNFK
jgi:hypothetical protein